MVFCSFDNTVLLIDKPEGITSNDVIEKVKRITCQKKVGHAGTLDKFATGLLIVATGKATKLLKYFLAGDKQYEALIRLGILTDTLDPEGSIIKEMPVPTLSDELVDSIRKNFLGIRKQIPPIYSALKIKGSRASDLVRSGIEVKMREREITIKDLVIKQSEVPNCLFLQVHCSRGTYVRALARDIAESLGTVGYLLSLRRIKVGYFNVEEAITLDELMDCCRRQNHLKKWLLAPYESLREYGCMWLKDSGMKKAMNGSIFSPDEIRNIECGNNRDFMILTENKKLVAIVECDFEKWSLRYLDVFPEPI